MAWWDFLLRWEWHSTPPPLLGMRDLPTQNCKTQTQKRSTVVCAVRQSHHIPPLPYFIQETCTMYIDLNNAVTSKSTITCIHMHTYGTHVCTYIGR